MSEQPSQPEPQHRSVDDDALVVNLARGFSVKQAAATAGCSARTVSRRMADPDFRKRVQDARTEMLDSTLGRLLSATTDAVLTLHTLAKPTNNNAPDKVKIAAARAVIDLYVRIKDVADLETRLSAIEEKLNKRGGK